MFALFQYIFLSLHQLPQFGCLLESGLRYDFDCVFLCWGQIVSQVDVTPVALPYHPAELDIMLLVYSAGEINLGSDHAINIKYK